MKRRAFIAALGGAAAWPVVARGQQPAIPNIGFLGSQSAEGFAPMLQGFREGLEEGGFREGTNVIVDYRWAHNEMERLPALAQEIVALRPRVIAATGGSDALVAAKAATSSIPIVFVSGVDPVETGIVPSLKSGGNITGVTFFMATLIAKRLEILRQALPSAKVFGILLDPRGPDGRASFHEIRTLQSQGQDFIITTATTAAELDAAFANLAANHVDALLFVPQPMFQDHWDIIAANLERLRLPAINSSMLGGLLVSYGPSIPEAYRVCGFKITRILLGTKPADLPIEQSTKLIMKVNLKTARALGLEISPTLLARADKVIE
jgi:putative ABC transport system substrate-binding protein